MATDYAEMEREFLAGLEADTGHDLAGWMALIDAQALPHRNDIIDWLRGEGFLFSWASWLERIHHNGGRPIYAAAAAGAAPTVGPPAGNPEPPRRTLRPSTRTPVVVPSVVMSPLAGQDGATTQATTSQTAAHAPSQSADAVAGLLARAKAYRPLAEHLIREIRKVLPDVTITAHTGHLALARGGEFAALVVSPRELRLGLDLGEDVADAPLPRGRLPGVGARISHVQALTDARQVTPALIAALCRAAQHVKADR